METTESAQHAQSRAHQPPRNRRPPSAQPRYWETPAQFRAPSALAGPRRLPPAAEPRCPVAPECQKPQESFPNTDTQCEKSVFRTTLSSHLEGLLLTEWKKIQNFPLPPERLLWPKSKCYDYLYQEAQTLLKNFPIQATISFYEESDSEDEFEELPCENQPN